MGAAARTAATVAATLVGVGALSLALLVAGMRLKLPAVLDIVRLFGVSQCLHLEKS
jgi:hypothetical protein